MAQSVIQVNSVQSFRGLTVPANFIAVVNFDYTSSVIFNDPNYELLRRLDFSILYYASAAGYEAGDGPIQVDGLPNAFTKVFNDTEWNDIFNDTDPAIAEINGVMSNEIDTIIGGTPTSLITVFN